jgi:hypothetical protein
VSVANAASANRTYAVVLLNLVLENILDIVAA